MTTPLLKCSHDDCDPVEQIRGEMKPEHYHDIRLRGLPADAEKPEELFDGLEGERGPGAKPVASTNRTDFRICCPKCGKSTHTRDNDEMPFASFISTFTRFSS